MTTVGRAVAPFGSHHFSNVHSHLCIILDPSRLEMSINKIEVFVYSSDDSTGNKKKKKKSSSVNDNASVCRRCERAPAQTLQPIRSIKCLALRGPCVTCCCPRGELHYLPVVHITGGETLHSHSCTVLWFYCVLGKTIDT